MHGSMTTDYTKQTLLKVAITENADLRKIAESLIGAKLGGGGNLKEVMKKMPAGGLLGLIILIFGLLGSGLFGKPKM